MGISRTAVRSGLVRLLALAVCVSALALANRSAASDAPTDVQLLEPPVISFTSGPELSTTSPRVGEPLQVVHADDGPPEASRTVQWYAGGSPVDGATGASFVPTPSRWVPS
jgi:hypothetical protein